MNATKVKDPVCGMEVDPARAAARQEYGGELYFFCCAGCQKKFAADPDRYLSPAAPLPVMPAARDAIYTCPMHPEIEQVGPGACPKCGMALEPKEITAGGSDDSELRDMTQRLVIAVALTIPVAMLDMVGRWPLAQALLATPVVLWCGWPFFARGWSSVRHRHLNMFTLIALGVGVAYGDSLVAMARGGGWPVYFEAAAVIVALVLVGQVLELRARGRTSAAIQALLGLAPKTARLVTGPGQERDVRLEEVRPGNRLRVRPGEAVPTDGVIEEGDGLLDEAMLTGEAMPVSKAVGDRVTGGTLNQNGSFVMRAERVGSDTVLANIVRLVSQAQRTRAPIQRLADTVASYFVPAVAGVAGLTFAIWYMIGPPPHFAHAMVNAVAVLIIACPCALGLATPMSVMVASGRGASSGVLFRDAEAIERLSRVDTVVLDKTGTLTEGKPTVTKLLSAPDFDEARLLALAASLELSSEHPLAAAIVAAARERGLPLIPAVEFTATPGLGVRASLGGQPLLLGSLAFVQEAGVAAPADFEAWACEMRSEGATVVALAQGGRMAGLIGVSDPLRAGSAAAVAGLQRQGARVIMLTGDHRGTAEAVARRAGIGEVMAEVLPAGKQDAIARLQAEGRVVAMVGDGINDAPALAQANVGVALAGGSDIALESAQVTLVHGDLGGLLRARRLSRATLGNIRQNLFFAFVYNSLGIPIAAGVLYPVFGWLLSPVIAAAAMSLSSVSVVANALRLRRVPL